MRLPQQATDPRGEDCAVCYATSASVWSSNSFLRALMGAETGVLQKLHLRFQSDRLGCCALFVTVARALGSLYDSYATQATCHVGHPSPSLCACAIHICTRPKRAPTVLRLTSADKLQLPRTAHIDVLHAQLNGTVINSNHLVQLRPGDSSLGNRCNHDLQCI